MRIVSALSLLDSPDEVCADLAKQIGEGIPGARADLILVFVTSEWSRIL